MNRMYLFIYTPPRAIILSVVEGIWNYKEALRYDLVFKMIEELDGIHKLDGFDQVQIRDIFRGLIWYNE